MKAAQAAKLKKKKSTPPRKPQYATGTDMSTVAWPGYEASVSWPDSRAQSGKVRSLRA